MSDPLKQLRFRNAVQSELGRELLPEETEVCETLRQSDWTPWEVARILAKAKRGAA